MQKRDKLMYKKGRGSNVYVLLEMMLMQHYHTDDHDDKWVRVTGII